MKNIYDEITLLIISHKSSIKVKSFIKKINPKYKILIIENSKDHSIKKILSSSNNNIRILLSKNNGYGSAINLGRRNIDTKFFFLFNPDVGGVSEDVIEKIYLIAKKIGNTFCCIGPRFLNLKENIKQSNNKLKLVKIPISGAAMFFNVQTFDKLNGFDENFFLYFEENDFCKRGFNMNLPSYQLNTAVVTHNIGTSVEYKDDEEKKRYNELFNWHFIWSKCYFIKKHYGYLSTLLYFFPFLIKYKCYLFYFQITKNKNQFNKYKNRIDAIISVLIGKKAYKRIQL